MWRVKKQEKGGLEHDRLKREIETNEERHTRFVKQAAAGLTRNLATSREYNRHARKRKEPQQKKGE